MKDYLAAQVHVAPDTVQGRNVAREYLQARLLGALQRAGALIPLAFRGGTALRFLYAAQRYSEDLDFALESSRERYDFRAYLRAIQAELQAEGYAVEIKVSDRKVVHSAFVRFPGLLYEMGLSPHRHEVLAVKLKVDTDPPAGAGTETTVVRRHILLRLQHHDRASLLAGKLHAVLQRPHLKGRDIYDLLWYLSAPDWPAPNLALLNHALTQTGWPGGALDARAWPAAVAARLRSADWAQVVADVRPFLEPGGDATLLTPENLAHVLRIDDSPRPVQRD